MAVVKGLLWGEDVDDNNPEESNAEILDVKAFESMPAEILDVKAFDAEDPAPVTRKGRRTSSSGSRSPHDAKKGKNGKNYSGKDEGTIEFVTPLFDVETGKQAVTFDTEPGETEDMVKKAEQIEMAVYAKRAADEAAGDIAHVEDDGIDDEAVMGLLFAFECCGLQGGGMISAREMMGFLKLLRVTITRSVLRDMVSRERVYYEENLAKHHGVGSTERSEAEYRRHVKTRSLCPHYKSSDPRKFTLDCIDFPLFVHMMVCGLLEPFMEPKVKTAEEEDLLVLSRKKYRSVDNRASIRGASPRATGSGSDSAGKRSPPSVDAGSPREGLSPGGDSPNGSSSPGSPRSPKASKNLGALGRQKSSVRNAHAEALKKNRQIWDKPDDSLTWWHDGVTQMRVLRMGFTTGDFSGDGLLEFEEFSAMVNSLHAGHLTEEDVQGMWNIMNPVRPNGTQKTAVEFVEYLQGICHIRDHISFSQKFELLPHDLLMELVYDTPCGRPMEQRICVGMDKIEKSGIDILQRNSREWSHREKRNVMMKYKRKEMHTITDANQKKNSKIHRASLVRGFLIGALTCLLLVFFEFWLTGRVGCNGDSRLESMCTDGNYTISCIPESAFHSESSLAKTSYEYPIGVNFKKQHCVPLCAKALGKLPENTVETECSHVCMDGSEAREVSCEHSKSVSFWSSLIFATAMQATVEIGLLYFYCVKYSVQVADCLDLRLLPLNKERAFVAVSLVRAALNMVNPEPDMMGLTPQKPTNRQCVRAMLVCFYKLKVLLSAFVFKVFARRFMTRAAARTVLPYVVVPVTGLWDAACAHTSTKEAMVRAMGFAAGIELFNEVVFKDDSVTGDDKRARVECLRAIGVIIRSNRQVYPTKEILLRHAAMRLPLSRAMNPDELELGDSGAFLTNIAELSKESQRTLLEVMCVAILVDGKVTWREEEVLKKAILVVDDSVATKDGQVIPRLRVLAQNFCDLSTTVTPEDVQKCICTNVDDGFKVPFKYVVTGIWNGVIRLFTC